MARYKIWDKISDIYTPGVDPAHGSAKWTAEEYIAAKAPWADNPNAKVIVSAGVINGAVFQEYTTTVEQYRRMGAAITDDMTDEEVLAAIEAFEDTPPEVSTESTAEERIAAALEYQALASQPTVNTDDPAL